MTDEYMLGTISQKKECLLSGVAQISPPLPPIQATWTWSSFFGRQKQRIARMTEKDT